MQESPVDAARLDTFLEESGLRNRGDEVLLWLGTLVLGLISWARVQARRFKDAGEDQAATAQEIRAVLRAEGEHQLKAREASLLVVGRAIEKQTKTSQIETVVTAPLTSSGVLT